MNQIIKTKEVEDVTYFCLGSASPSTVVLHGRKQSARLYHDNDITEVPLDQVVYEDNLYYFTLKIKGLVGPQELSKSLRPQAKEYVAAFLEGARKLSDKLSLVGGMVGFSSFWFTQTPGQVLFLSDQMSRLISDSLNDEQRSLDQTCWLCPQAQDKHKLSYQALELLYYSLTGKPPLLEPYVRFSGYKIDKLSYLESRTSVDISKTLSYIDYMLSFNAKSFDLLPSQILKNLQDLAWPQEISQEILFPTDKSLKATKVLQNKSKTRTFFRKRGTLILIILVAAIAVGSFLVSYIARLTAPPKTASMDEIGIIQSYYEGQSQLDVEKLEDSLAKGVHSPAFYEVTSLFVTRQMRQSYENLTTSIEARTWLDQGMPAIPATYTIYGPGEVTITKDADGSYLADFLFYSTYDYELENEEYTIEEPQEKTSLMVYVYKERDRFTLDYHKGKDYLEITSVDIVSQVKVDTMEVPYISQ